MQLSPHFSLEELTFSELAARYEIDNTPHGVELRHLTTTAGHMEEIRTALRGLPILVSSGFRCPQLNSLVKGSQNSAHMKGYAVDFRCPSFGAPKFIWEHLQLVQNIKFDQLILEYGRWVHVSFDPRYRRESFTIG